MVAVNTKVLHANFYKDLRGLEKEIKDALGDTSSFEVFGQRVLIAVYAQPTMYRGTIIMPDAVQNEDMWQSKCGLVLKIGGEAFHNLSEKQIKDRFNGRIPKVGEWIYHDVKATNLQMNFQGEGSINLTAAQLGGKARKWVGWPVRTVYSNDIEGRTTRPQDII